MIRTTGISILLLIISGCSLLQPNVKPIEVVTVAEPAPLYHPPLPLEVQLTDITWRVLTPEIMQQYLQELEEGSAPPQAYYALTNQNYENLATNTAEQKRYIRDVLSIIKYYRDLDKEEGTDSQGENPEND